MSTSEEFTPSNWKCPGCLRCHSPKKPLTFFRGSCLHDACVICISGAANRRNLVKRASTRKRAAEVSAGNLGKVPPIDVPCPMSKCSGRFIIVGTRFCGGPGRSSSDVINLCDEEDGDDGGKGEPDVHEEGGEERWLTPSAVTSYPNNLTKRVRVRCGRATKIPNEEVCEDKPGVNSHPRSRDIKMDQSPASPEMVHSRQLGAADADATSSIALPVPDTTVSALDSNKNRTETITPNNGPLSTTASHDATRNADIILPVSTDLNDGVAYNSGANGKRDGIAGHDGIEYGEESDEESRFSEIDESVFGEKDDRDEATQDAIPDNRFKATPSSDGSRYWQADESMVGKKVRRDKETQDINFDQVEAVLSSDRSRYHQAGKSMVGEKVDMGEETQDINSDSQVKASSDGSGYHQADESMVEEKVERYEATQHTNFEKRVEPEMSSDGSRYHHVKQIRLDLSSHSNIESGNFWSANKEIQFTDEAFMTKPIFHLNSFVDGKKKKNHAFGLFIREGVATCGFRPLPKAINADMIVRWTQSKLRDAIIRHNDDEWGASQMAMWLKQADCGSFIVMRHEYPRCKFCPARLKDEYGKYIGPVYVIGVITKKVVPGSAEEANIAENRMGEFHNVFWHVHNLCMVSWRRMGYKRSLREETRKYINHICQPTVQHICHDPNKIHAGGATMETIRQDLWANATVKIRPNEFLDRFDYTSSSMCTKKVAADVSLPSEPSDSQYYVGEKSDCNHPCQDPKDGELCLNKQRSGEIEAEDVNDSDLLIQHEVWV